MLVIPAIDLKDGQAVRLYKGDYNQKTVYSNNPEELAKEFETMGKTRLPCTIDHAKVITSISFRNGHKAPPKSLGHPRLREPRRQPL